MIDISTGKEITRRDFGLGLAAIIGAGVAPSIALSTVSLAGSANASVRGMMRGVGARNAAMFGGGKPTAKDYVQDALIFHLDGIENNGYGIHNDVPTKWYDLTGNYGPYYLNGHISASSNSMVFDGTTGSYIDTGTRFGELNDYSIEIVFRYTRLSGEYYSVFSCIENGGSGFQSGGGFIGAMVGKPAGGYYALSSKRIVLNETKTYSLTLDSVNGLERLYEDSEKYHENSDYTLTRWNSKTFLIGVDAGDESSGMFCGDLYSIRFYNRNLTDSEVSANYAIDKARFNLP